MEHPFNVESPNREPLAALVTRVVDVETRIRSLQAERSTLLAQAHALAEREGLGSVERETGSLGANGEVSAANDAAAAGDLAVMPRSLSTRVALPRGTVTRRDRAHRVVRAEIAAALHVSEWCVGHDITHAVELLERCPALHTAQACGDLTPRHIRSVVDAGRVIEHWATEPAGSTLTDEHGQELTLEEAQGEVSRRHAQYAAAVLPYAQALTPAELVPVAKRLAEKFAGVSFDDRHQRAARDRRVWITDLDDGMSHLTAYLTSVEAHAIFDRLTQLGRHLQEDDVAGSGVTSVTSSGPATLVAPGADRAVAPRGVAVSGVDAAASEVPTEAEVAVTAEAVKRPLPEARADSLVSLLLTGETEPDPGATKRLGPRVSARVQVLVPVSLTGLLQRSKRGADGVLGITRVAAGPSEDAGATGGPADEVTAHASGQTNGTPVAPDAFLFQPELVGVGPMDSDTAARIAHDASTWDLVVVDDGVGGIDTLGDVLTVEGYRVPAKLRRYLAARDQRCRFPGCTLPVFRCDIDHTIAAEDGGPTSTDNLGHLCRGHHVLKHHGGCLVVQRDRGEYDWTFPSGRRYTTKAPSKVTFSSAIGPPEIRTTTRPPGVQDQAAADREKHPYGDGFDASLGLDESSEASRPPPEPPPF